MDTTAGRDVLTLMREEVLTELSVEFRPLRGKYDVVRRGPDDVLIRHHKAELVGVSPVGSGAYGDQARVLMVRSAERESARAEALAQLASLTAGSIGRRVSANKQVRVNPRPMLQTDTLARRPTP